MQTKEEREGKKFPGALLLIGLVVLACYVVPYTILSTVAEWYGSFLFWCAAGAAIIGLNVAATADFGKEGK